MVREGWAFAGVVHCIATAPPCRPRRGAGGKMGSWVNRHAPASTPCSGWEHPRYSLPFHHLEGEMGSLANLERTGETSVERGRLYGRGARGNVC